MSDYRSNLDDPSPAAPRGPDSTVADRTVGDAGERDRTGGAMWGWIAGIAVLILIGFIIVGGWSFGSRTGTNRAANSPASTAPAPPATTGAAPSAPASR